MRLRRILLAVGAVAAAVLAQTADKPLTNTEIASMLASRLPESTILLKIQIAASRGLVNLDASSIALIDLKQRGASEQVLNAVMWAEPFGAALKRQQEEDRAAAGLPRASGVYYQAPSGWVVMPSSLVWPPYYSFSGLAFMRARDYNVPLGGSHADLQIAGRQPVFILRAPTSLTWRIVRLTSRDDERLLRIASTGHPATTAAFDPARTRQVQVTRLANEIFSVRPAAPLEPGEYVLCAPVPGAANVSACYGFGIQH
jgi:hypothetical protein